MVEFSPLTLNVADGARCDIAGDYILRGTLGRGAQLAVNGNLKLGEFSQLGEGVTVTTPAGAAVLSDKFKVPYGLRIHADQIMFNDPVLPESNLLAPAITCESENISAASTFILPNHQTVHFRAPQGAEESFLQLGTADGHSATVEGFDEVAATHLQHFSLSPNKPCGINCRRFQADAVEDSMIRAHQVRVGTVRGKVEFMPQNGAWDFNANEVRGVLPGDAHIEPGLWGRLLRDQGSHEYLRLSAISILTRVVRHMNQHQRDFARHADVVRKVRASLNDLEEMDAMLTTDSDRKKLINLLRNVPGINIPQMLYRHAKDAFDIATPWRVHVTVDDVGDEKKPADMLVHFGNVTVRKSVAAGSVLSLENGMVTLGTEGQPVTIGKNATIRANEIHLHEVPSLEMLKRNNIRLEGQVYCNGKLIEELSNLRTGKSPGR